MTNPFYTRAFDVTPGSSNQSRPVENEYAAVATAFDLVYAWLQRSLRAPTGEAPGELPNKDTRKNKSAGYDANGDPTVFASATTEEMDAAIAAAIEVAADADAAAASAASVASSSSYIQQLMLVQGVK